MNAILVATAAFAIGLFMLQENEGPAVVLPPVATCPLSCPSYDETAHRYLRLILSEEDFHDFVLEAGAEGVNPDSLVMVTDTLACAALDSALVTISAQADPAYYEYARYDRAFFESGGLYFAVEWPKPPEDPWQVVGGPSYFTAFGLDFAKRAEVSL